MTGSAYLADLHPWNHAWCDSCAPHANWGRREPDHDHCDQKCGQEGCALGCQCICRQPLTPNEIVKLRRLAEDLR